MKKLKAEGVLRVRVYPLLEEAVERAVAYGLNRAYKHEDNPTRETVGEAIRLEVMNELCELFDFGNADDSF